MDNFYPDTLKNVVVHFDTELCESLLSSGGPPPSASLQFITANVTEENVSTIKGIVDELVEQTIAHEVFPNVLALQETTSWVLSQMDVPGYICVGSEAGLTAFSLSTVSDVKRSREGMSDVQLGRCPSPGL